MGTKLVVCEGPSKRNDPDYVAYKKGQKAARKWRRLQDAKEHLAALREALAAGDEGVAEEIRRKKNEAKRQRKVQR